jgi:hypothetical protein
MRTLLSADDADAADVDVCAIAGTVRETAATQAARIRTRTLCAPIVMTLSVVGYVGAT